VLRAKLSNQEGIQRFSFCLSKDSSHKNNVSSLTVHQGEKGKYNKFLAQGIQDYLRKKKIPEKF